MSTPRRFAAVSGRVVTDEYGDRVCLTQSGDGYRAHLCCANAEGSSVIAFPLGAPPTEAPKPSPTQLGYLSRGGGFHSPESALALAELLITYARGVTAAKRAMRAALARRAKGAAK